MIEMLPHLGPNLEPVNCLGGDNSLLPLPRRYPELSLGLGGTQVGTSKGTHVRTSG